MNPTHKTDDRKNRYQSRLFALPASARNDRTGWSARHRAALRAPRGPFEPAYVHLLRGWLCYADAHREQYHSGIGDDGVLGPHWARIGADLRGLLNGELGRLDGGTLDGLICRTLEAEGFDPNRL